MSAEIEKIVGRADAVDLQNIFPDIRQFALKLAARRYERKPRSRLTGFGQRLAVDLGVRRHRQCRQPHITRGDHVIGQALPQELPQLGDIGRGLRAGDHIGAQAEFARRVRPGLERGRDKRGVARQGRLDLFKLDAEAADFNLLIVAAEAFDGAVGSIAREIAGAINPLAPGGRDVHKTLARQVVALVIAARQPRPRQCTIRR